jgi:hypothetical protein
VRKVHFELSPVQHDQQKDQQNWDGKKKYQASFCRFQNDYGDLNLENDNDDDDNNNNVTKS